MPNKLSDYHEKKQVKKEIVKSKLEKKIDDFFWAIRYDQIVNVKKLLNDGLDVNSVKDGSTGLACAYSKGKINIVDELLKHPDVNVNVKVDGEIILICKAIYRGDVNMVKKLIDTGKVAVNDPDAKILSVAVYMVDDDEFDEISKEIREEVLELILSVENFDENLLAKGLGAAVCIENKKFAQKIIDLGAKKELLPTEEQKDLEALLNSDFIIEKLGGRDSEDSVALKIASDNSTEEELSNSKTHSLSEEVNDVIPSDSFAKAELTIPLDSFFA